MTRRERLQAVINGNITEELIEECREELKKLNAQGAAALAKSKESTQYKENQIYAKRVVELLQTKPGEGWQIGEILAEVAPTLTRQRMTAICTNLLREERIHVRDVKVKGKGVRKAYYI